ncbi:hypothetical protein ACFY19_35985 [Streptosporangium saharense]|uniref:hypothetical protein n=1 Tax=Streptosporangium saharense TaxID=1706840 RepID=UPI0036C7B549
MRRVHIAEIVIPDGIESKIRSKHNLTGEDVRESLIYGKDVQGEEQYHERYGWRLLVRGETFDGIRFQAWLYEIDKTEGTYRLGTAYEQ